MFLIFHGSNETWSRLKAVETELKQLSVQFICIKLSDFLQNVVSS